MPKYDFVCLNCEETIEVEMSIHDWHRPACKNCGEFMNKVYTAPGLQFKGGGWGGQG